MKKKDRIVQAIGGAFKRTDSVRGNKDKGIELKDFNNIDNYLIDDEDVSDAPKRSEGGNRSAREIVFDTDEI